MSLSGKTKEPRNQMMKHKRKKRKKLLYFASNLNCLKASRKGKQNCISFKQLKQCNMLFQKVQKMIEVLSTSKIQMIL